MCYLCPQREWFVIENTRAYSVWASDDLPKIAGYIPREVAEEIVGHPITGDFWFTSEHDQKIFASPTTVERETT